MELVHHHGGDGGEIERLTVQEPIEKDLSYHHQHFGLRVDPAVAGDQTDIISRKPPANGSFLQFVKLLLRQGNQRGGVVGGGAGVQRLEHGRLGNQGLASAGGRTDQNPLLRVEPGEHRIFLKRIRGIRERVEIFEGQLIARRRLTH